MKRIIAIVGLILLSGGALTADIGIVGKKEMVTQSELIALVDILELVSTNKNESYADLIATARVAEVFKGNAGKEITFRIPRFFPCAAFDVSKGKHLVFLAKNEKGEYAGVNWYMSYLYLDGKTIEWFNEKDEIVETDTPGQVIRDIKRLVGAQSSSHIDSYTLTVELNTPFNKNFIMKTFVVPGKPFELTELNGGTRNTISGVLQSPVDGKYRIDLTVSEWVSEKSNIKDTTELNLELDRAWSGGPVSSFMYLRTVTLSKVEL